MRRAQARSLIAVGKLLPVFLVPLGLALTFSGWIELEFSNPGGIVGKFSRLRYHPANDVLRFLLIVGAPACALLAVYGIRATRMWLPLRQMAERQPRTTRGGWRWIWVATAALVWMGVVSVHYQTQACSPFTKSLDLYHEGMALGAATDWAHGLEPYRDTVYGRGWFLDTGVALSAFAILGRSIHSVRLLNALFTTLAFLLAVAVVAYLSRNEPAYLPAAIGCFFILTSCVHSVRVFSSSSGTCWLSRPVSEMSPRRNRALNAVREALARRG